MIALCVFITTAGVALSLPAWSLLVLTLCAGRQPKSDTATTASALKAVLVPAPRVAILVPAHNESSNILPTLACLLLQLKPSDRLLVIADNCTDDTAALAAAAGATVVARHNADLRGKGYALAFGVDALRADPPDIVVVIDADCTVSSDAIAQVCRHSIQTACPVQMLNLMHAPPSAGLRVRTLEFAWLVKNYVRPLGTFRLGATCHLMGTGMAIPWPLMSTANLATGHIAEDMKLGVDLALAGHPTQFFPAARVDSFFPTDSAVARVQKSRWEHGHLTTLTQELPRLLGQALLTRKASLWALSLDLLIPPLALYFLLLVTIMLPISVVGGIFVPIYQPLAMFMCVTALAFGVAVGLSWGRYARHLLSLRELVLAPLYALWKIPVYIAYALYKRSGWVRTERN